MNDPPSGEAPKRTTRKWSVNWAALGAVVLGVVLLSILIMTSSPPSQGTPLLTDNFADEVASEPWLAGVDRRWDVRWSDGALSVAVTSQSSEAAIIGRFVDGTYESVQVVADVEPISGPASGTAWFGVACGMARPQGPDVFSAEPEAAYAFAASLPPQDSPSAQAAIFRLHPGRPTHTLGISTDAEGVLQTGVLNRIRGECLAGGPGEAATLALSINDRELLGVQDHEDPIRSFNSISLFVLSDAAGAVVRFDDVLMSEL